MTTEHKKFWKMERGIYRFLIVVCALVLILAIIAIYFIDESNNEPNSEYIEVSGDDPDKIENGIHIRTGLVEADGLMETVNNCTTCHSAHLLIQNRLTKEQWKATIKWMQETQNLWELGKNEEIIINYLATNYPPKKKGRRENLEVEEWYVLEE